MTNIAPLELTDPTGRAARMLAFARLLRHPKSETPGSRLMLGEWQQDIIRKIYGPTDEEGRRLVRTVMILLPRGNRKTSLASVLALAHAIGPEARPNGQVVLAASSRGQARIAFDEASGILRMDDRLMTAAKIRDTVSKVTHHRTRATLEAIAADGDRAHGLTPSLALVDELHAWRGDRGRRLWDALRTGLAKTPGSLLVVASTAGEKPEGPLWELYQYARKILAGEIVDPSFLPIIFEAPPELAWDDEATWHVANPGLSAGYPDIAALRDAARLARQVPALRQAFETYHLNRWADGSAAGWVDMATWDAGATPVDPEALAGRPCWIGVDLSKSYDLTAIVAAFRDDDGGYSLLCRALLPEVTVKRRAAKQDIPWRIWERDGHLDVTPGAVQKEDVIEAAILDLCGRFDVREVAFDPAMAGRIMARLMDADVPVIEFPQKFRLISPAINEMQRAIVGGTLRHGGHPVLRWCVSNVVPVIGDMGDTRFSKKRSADSIDLAVAAAMAIGRASAASDPVVDLYDDPDFKPENAVFSW